MSVPCMACGAGFGDRDGLWSHLLTFPDHDHDLRMLAMRHCSATRELEQLESEINAAKTRSSNHGTET